MFGFQRRWSLRCECETDMPKPGPFPQTSQTAATSNSSKSMTVKPGQPRSRDTRVPAPSGRAQAGRAGRWLPWAPVPALPGPALVLAWARASLTRLAAHRPELDGINVFPVADADTGTNLLLTMRSAVDAAEAAAAGPEAVAAALARGALLGA